MIDQNRLEELITYGKKLDLGQILEETFDNYRKVIVQSGVVLLVLSLITMAILMGVGILLATAGTFTENMLGVEQPFGSLQMVVNLVSNLLASCLMAPITAGLVNMSHNAAKGVPVHFSQAFDYFKSAQLKDLLLSTFLITLFTQLTGMLLLLFVQGSNQTPDLPVLAVLMLFNVVVFVLTYLMLPLIMYAGQNAVEAIRTSVVLSMKKFWLLLLLLFVVGFFSVLGFIALCVGLFFTLPALFSLKYVVYQNYVGIDETDEMEQIGTHFDDFNDGN